MNLDVIIPLRDRPSLYNDMELKYCLRSIDKHMNVRDVWCVGIPRDWLSVNWIPHPDIQGNYDERHESVRRKILKACRSPFISDPFLLFNDDFFLLRGIDHMYDYYDGTIPDRLKDAAAGYRKRMEATIPYSDGKNYEVHTPVLINKKLFIEVAREGMLYRNIYCSASDTEKKSIKDPKLYLRSDHDKFRDFAKQNWMFSTSEFSFALLMKDMDRLYPEKSRWE